MVGNACTDPDECYVPGDGMSMYQYEFLYEHTYLSDDEYMRLRGACALAYHGE